MNELASENAIVLLTHDHRMVEAAFKEFEGLGDRAYVTKKQLADKICSDLLTHMIAEEEIFYTAFRKLVKDSDSLMNEAVVEHSAAKSLIKEIQSMTGEEHLFCAKVTVLSEQISHHVKEEEEDAFPKARRSDMDLVGLGHQIAKRKEQLANVKA